MYKKIFLILTFVVILISIDRLLSYGLNLMLKAVESGLYSDIDLVLNKQKSDILILGSSRANSHYDSRVIKKSSGLFTYNAGLGGQGYTYTEIIVRSSLKTHKPELVILDLSVNLFTDAGDFDKTKILMPFAYNNAIVRDVLQRNDDKLQFKTLMSTYYFNSALYDLLDGVFVLKSRDTTLHGFAPLKKIMDQPSFGQKRNPVEFTENSEREILGYKNTLIELKKSKVSFLVVVSPIYEPHWYKNDKNYLWLINLAKDNGATVLDYSLDPRFRGKKELFKDRIHLYEDGAKLFTEILVDDLKKLGILK